VRNIPMYITAMNAISGIVAIYMAYKGHYGLSMWCFVVAAIFDGMDGWVARRLKVERLAGANADMAADLISFAIAPTAILIIISNNQWGLWAALFFCAMIILRLIRYRLMPMPAGVYLGLPSPVAATPVVAAVLMAVQVGNNMLFPIIITVVAGILAIVPIQFPAWRHVSIKSIPKWIRAIYFSSCIICLFIFTEETVLATHLVYIIVSPLLLAAYISKNSELTPEEARLHDSNR